MLLDMRVFHLLIAILATSWSSDVAGLNPPGYNSPPANGNNYGSSSNNNNNGLGNIDQYFNNAVSSVNSHWGSPVNNNNNNGFPVNNNGFPPNNNGFPANSNGFQANNNGYPVNNNGFSANNNGYQANNNNGFPVNNNNGFAPNNNGYPVNNNNGFPVKNDISMTNNFNSAVNEVTNNLGSVGNNFNIRNNNNNNFNTGGGTNNLNPGILLPTTQPARRNQGPSNLKEQINNNLRFNDINNNFNGYSGGDNNAYGTGNNGGGNYNLNTGLSSPTTSGNRDPAVYSLKDQVRNTFDNTNNPSGYNNDFGTGNSGNNGGGNYNLNTGFSSPTTSGNRDSAVYSLKDEVRNTFDNMNNPSGYNNDANYNPTTTGNYYNNNAGGGNNLATNLPIANGNRLNSGPTSGQLKSEVNDNLKFNQGYSSSPDTRNNNYDVNVNNLKKDVSNNIDTYNSANSMNSDLLPQEYITIARSSAPAQMTAYVKPPDNGTAAYAGFVGNPTAPGNGGSNSAAPISSSNGGSNNAYVSPQIARSVSGNFEAQVTPKSVAGSTSTNALTGNFPKSYFGDNPFPESYAQNRVADPYTVRLNGGGNSNGNQYMPIDTNRNIFDTYLNRRGTTPNSINNNNNNNNGLNAMNNGDATFAVAAAAATSGITPTANDDNRQRLNIFRNALYTNDGNNNIFANRLNQGDDRIARSSVVSEPTIIPISTAYIIPNNANNNNDNRGRLRNFRDGFYNTNSDIDNVLVGANSVDNGSGGNIGRSTAASRLNSGADPFGDYRASLSKQSVVHATCTMEPAANALYNVTGIVHFVQSVTSLNYPLGLLEVRIQLQGFSTEDSDLEHGMHVHTYGDLSNSCTASGSHYNPLNSVHGARTSPVRHAGDFGNVREDQQGRVAMEFKDRHASLVGDHSIMGRALVIHSGADDNGLGGNDASLKNGNSGSPVACCVIAYASDNSWSGIQDPGIL